MSTLTIKSKPHFPILDGLRGVAALMVVAFHIFEAHNTNPPFDQIINHGYLAVDFFFLLSGYVIGYAYDDRWDTMTIGNFFKRRLIRLQPMVIMGMIIGALLFYFQDSLLWPHIHEVPVWKMLIIMLIGFTLIPIPPSYDIRGWVELHPLNGPGWSLFYEYVGNIIYALFVRKFSNTILSILVFISGCALMHLAVTSPNGDIIGVALDLDSATKSVTFYQNGSQVASATFSYDGTSSTCFPFIRNNSGAQSQWNFGNPPFTIASGNADANGYGNFEYAVPSGYYALCTKNLAQYG